MCRRPDVPMTSTKHSARSRGCRRFATELSKAASGSVGRDGYVYRLPSQLAASVPMESVA
jgi:hypothetical protein